MDGWSDGELPPHYTLRGLGWRDTSNVMVVPKGDVCETRASFEADRWTFITSGVLPLKGILNSAIFHPRRDNISILYAYHPFIHITTLEGKEHV